MTSLPTRHAIAGMIAAQALYMSAGAAIAAAPTDVNPAPQIQNPYQQTAAFPIFQPVHLSASPSSLRFQAASVS